MYLMETRTKKLAHFVFSLVVSLFALVPLISFAQANNSYELLAPLPGFGPQVYTTGNFSKYVESIIYLSITIAAILAVINIVIGGFKYMTNEGLNTKEEGKDQIKRSVLGLVVLASSFLILNTINPQILNFQLDIAKINVPLAKPSTAPSSQKESIIQYTNSTVNVAFDANNNPVELFRKPYTNKNKSEEISNLKSYTSECIGSDPNNPIGSPATIRGDFVCYKNVK